jgi:hypothetical protein
MHNTASQKHPKEGTEEETKGLTSPCKFLPHILHTRVYFLLNIRPQTNNNLCIFALDDYTKV